MDMPQIEKKIAQLDGYYSFFYQKGDTPPILHEKSPSNQRFLTASLIKVPILLAAMVAERKKFVWLKEKFSLTQEKLVEGAGFAHLMEERCFHWNDLLLMMIATSDNLCTNIVIQRLGFDYINQVFRDQFDLFDTHLGRKMMQTPDPAHGIDNWTTTRDVVRLYDLINDLPAFYRNRVIKMLSACQADNLLLRSLPGDTVDFYHKTGGLANVKGDWGFTLSSDKMMEKKLFLITNDCTQGDLLFDIFAMAGKLLMD